MTPPLQLTLLRHAKSDWEASFSHDYQRPLAPRGERDAAQIGVWLMKSGLLPDKVIASGSVRTRQTLALAQQGGNWPPVATQFDDRLYESWVDQVVAVVQAESENTRHLLLLGHEPVWSELALWLMGGGDLRLPTAAVAHFTLHIDHWRELKTGCGQLQGLVTPRLLAASATA